MKLLLTFILSLIFLLPLCAQYTLNGDASGSDGCYNLTDPINAQLSSLWYDNQIDLNDPFELNFVIHLGSNDDNGADGIVFALQTLGLNAQGGSGQFIGYGNGTLSPSFGIEYDTYYNPGTGQNNSDIVNDHIAFLRDGDTDHTSINNLAGPIDISSAGGNAEDGFDHIIKISWDPATQLIEAYFDCELRLSLNYDLVGDIFGGDSNVWWGFTASTGGYNNLQQVKFDDCFLSVDGPHTICENASVEINAFSEFNNPSLAETFSWSPDTGLNDPTIANPTASPTITTTYNLTYTDACGNVNTDYSVTVNVDAAEDATFDFPDFCIDDTNGPIDIVMPGGSFSFNPMPTDGATIDAATGIISNGVSGTTYTVEYTTNGACADIATHEVTILDEVDTSFSFNDFCVGEDNGPSDIVSPGGSFSFNPLPTDGVLIDAITGEISGEEPGVTYTVEYILNNTCGEPFSTTVTATPLIMMTMVDINICGSTGEQVDLTSYDSSIGSGSISWYEGDPSTGGVLINDATNYLPNNAVELWAMIEDGVNCSNQMPVPLLVETPPTLTLGLAICTDNSFTIDVLANGETGTSYNLSGSAISGVNPSTITTGESIRLDLSLGNNSYNLFVSGQDGLQCISDEYLIINPGCALQTAAPNAFSPNGDGINDSFRVSSNKDIETYVLQVYDRWGTMVFSTTDKDAAWDGSFKGELVDMGVYVYFAVLGFADGSEENVRGNVTIVR